MTPTTQRAEELFHAARRFGDPAVRKVFLDQACVGEETLRAEVETLLGASSAAERFFAEAEKSMTLEKEGATEEEPSASQLREVHFGDLAGTHIGRYRLLEKLGEGGCGVVYLAEQEAPVQRRVALKILKRGMEFRSVVARFEAERQALAIMDHPNIARVFDAGETDEGWPYFVMELVHGVPITEYCDNNRLGVRKRLGLFIQTCHAIQHAHQKGIIHRDIKPSNIVVAIHDGEAVPKVIDFGIAQATEARLTGKLSAADASQLIGTPCYMSPEQFELGWMEIDTRSDIYSLGVLLYELLTGKTPFESKELLEGGLDGVRSFLSVRGVPAPSARLAGLPSETLRAVAERRRCSPQKLAGALREDLDWAVKKALERDRSRRYETANGFALDIQRYLDSEALAAHPRSWLYTTRKLMRRNRAVFAACGAVAASLVVGLGTSTWLFLKERDARERAVAAEQQQVRLRHEAETREKVTQAALLVSLERYEEADRLVEKLSLTAPSVESAAILRALGEWHALQKHWKEAAERFEQLLKLNHLDGWDVATLDTLRLGPVLLEMGDLKGYERFREEALEHYQHLQSQAPDRIVKICLLRPVTGPLIRDMRPVVEQNRKLIAEAESGGDAFQSAWRSLSHALWEYRVGRYDEAVAMAERCLASSDYNAPRLATSFGILALSHQSLGNAAEARAAYAKGAEIVANKARTRLDRGTPVQGFWFDWIFAKLVLREAAAQLGDVDRL